MASQAQVKEYLAQWFQLGKKVILGKQEEAILPAKVLAGDRYSNDFEKCWERISQEEAANSYLEGTHQTIEQLLSPEWEITSCARCEMPIPMINLGVINTPNCPCSDLNNWPNPELPSPRSPVTTRDRIQQIRARLSTSKQLNSAQPVDDGESRS